jgi:hypothetical protein
MVVNFQVKHFCFVAKDHIVNILNSVSTLLYLHKFLFGAMRICEQKGRFLIVLQVHSKGNVAVRWTEGRLQQFNCFEGSPDKGVVHYIKHKLLFGWISNGTTVYNTVFAALVPRHPRVVLIVIVNLRN